MSSTYKKISVQSLQRRQQMQTQLHDEQQLIQMMNNQFQWSKHPVLCYQDSGLSMERVRSQNGLFRVNSFFDAFYYAYTKHGDIVMIPDEIWIMISLYLSTYIDENAEKLRKKIVRHEGVKVLTVVQNYGSAEETIQAQKKWDYFFDRIIELIKKQTLEGVVDELSCNFTTTNKTYKVISSAIIMSSLKKYFQYHRMFAGCGINNVYMAGNRQDWAKMIPKLQKLVKYDVDGRLKSYIKHMKVILDNFLQTFDGSPDVKWWNTIMTTPEQRQIYGGNQIEVQGWILNFFGIYQKHTFVGFPQFTVKVPIKLINEITNEEKSLLLVSDFVSVSKYNERTYKPDIGMCIFSIRSGPSRIEKVIKEIKEYAEKKKRKNQNMQVMKLAKVDFFAPTVKEVIKQSPKKRTEMGKIFGKKDEDKKHSIKNNEHLNLNIFKVEKK